jgi:hypothetical protein
MPDPRINEFRLTFIFGRTVLGAMTGDAGPGGALDFVRERDSYADWFDDTDPTRTDERPPPGSYAPPWPAHADRGFWHSYLDQEDGPLHVATISGRQAYGQLIPVRISLPLLLTAPLDDTTVTSEGFVWPWGAAIAVTLTHRRPLTGFDTLAEAAFVLRDEPYATRPAGASAPLAEHVARALAEISHTAFGAAPGQPWGQFSLHSTIRAAGERTCFDPAHEPVHRVLQAVTGFSPSWRNDELRDLEKVRVAGLSIQPKDQITMGIRRGCAIWSPEHFLAPSGAVHTVGCHHRNLVMATVQTQSLLRFVIGTGDRIAQGKAIEGDYQAITKRAVGALVRLWAGRKSYRSGVVMDYVEGDDDREAINRVRHEVDQGTVKFTTTAGG